jgi:hypothetical protein
LTKQTPASPPIARSRGAALAKLYHAADRDADAHAILATAVEGFPPTRQFTELTEAQALLAALAFDPSPLRQRGRPESREIKRAGQLVRRVPR